MILDYCYKLGLVDEKTNKIIDINKVTETVINPIKVYMKKNKNKFNEWLVKFRGVEKTAENIVSDLVNEIAQTIQCQQVKDKGRKKRNRL